MYIATHQEGSCHTDLAPWPMTCSLHLIWRQTGLESFATLVDSHDLFELWFICKICLTAPVKWFCGEYQWDNTHRTPSKNIALRLNGSLKFIPFTNKASGGNGIPVELFQILKDDAVKVLPQYASKFGKLSRGHRTGKGQFSFQFQRKAMPKNAQTTQLHSSLTLVK